MRSKQDNEVVKLLLAYAPRTITVKELGYESLIIGCGEVDPLTIPVSVERQASATCVCLHVESTHI